MDRTVLLRASRARAAVESGELHGRDLLELVLAVPFLDRDAWIDHVLGFPIPPPDIDLPRGSVPYLPCGVEDIVTMVRDVPVGPDDELVDLGSGLGRVVILAHLLSGARTSGIEIQHHLVQAARRRSVELGLRRVTFVHADAAAIELDGSIFFLYAPFNGDMLARAVYRLADVARRRRLVVCTAGLELYVPWLRRRPPSSRSLNIYDSQ